MNQFYFQTGNFQFIFHHSIKQILCLKKNGGLLQQSYLVGEQLLFVVGAARGHRAQPVFYIHIQGRLAQQGQHGLPEHVSVRGGHFPALGGHAARSGPAADRLGRVPVPLSQLAAPLRPPHLLPCQRAHSLSTGICLSVS